MTAINITGRILFLASDPAQVRAQLAGANLILPRTKPDAVNVFPQDVIRSSKRDGLKEVLQGRGTGTLIHYPVPIHKQPAYAGALTGRGGLPRTENAAAQILSLPMFPEVTDDQARTVAQQIEAYVGELAEPRQSRGV